MGIDLITIPPNHTIVYFPGTCSGLTKPILYLNHYNCISYSMEGIHEIHSQKTRQYVYLNIHVTQFHITELIILK